MIFKEYRKKLGLTQEQLAEMVDITWRQMQRIEKESSLPSLYTLRTLVIVLGISDSDLAEYIRNI